MHLQRILFILIVLFAFFNRTFGQEEECVPDGILTIQIYSNATLVWTLDPSARCDPTHFEVDIVGDGNDEYHFKVTETYVDVSFLGVCEEWRFTVTPHHDDTVGFARSLTSYVPLPSNADLSLSHFTATSLGGREVLLEWDLANKTYGDCSLYYRLSVADEDLGIAQDVYVQGTSLHLSFLSPCVQYELGLRAINRAPGTIEGPLLETFFEIDAKPQVAPTLASLDIQPTSFNMTWNLEGGTNRCPLKALHIDGSYFNITVDLINWQNSDPIPVELKSLQPNSMYFFRVSVENSGGSSQAIPLAVQTLELDPN